MNNKLHIIFVLFFFKLLIPLAPSMVKKLKVTKQSTTSIYMTWKEPDKTNGVILMYEVEIWQTNDDLSKPASEALPNTIMVR